MHQLEFFVPDVPGQERESIPELLWKIRASRKELLQDVYQKMKLGKRSFFIIYPSTDKCTGIKFCVLCMFYM